MKIFPLGSHCFVNYKLDGIKKLKDNKFFHSPFNGCRILNGFNQYFPQQEFLFNKEDFLSKYYDIENWETVTDGQDKEAINRKVNLRRCHIPWQLSIQNVLYSVKTSLDNAKKCNDDFLYIINMCNDFENYYDFKAFQHKCIDNNINILFLYQEKYKNFVDVNVKNTYSLGKEPNLENAVKAFYVDYADKIFKCL